LDAGLLFASRLVRRVTTSTATATADTREKEHLCEMSRSNVDDDVRPRSRRSLTRKGPEGTFKRAIDDESVSSSNSFWELPAFWLMRLREIVSENMLSWGGNGELLSTAVI
jgi:hypothetical protein